LSALLVLLALVLAIFPSSPLASQYRLDSTRNVIIVVVDGARYSETFGDPLHQHIPHIWNDLRPLGSIITAVYNAGVTETCSGHANISTGTWQDIANDGSERPHKPTFFEYYRREFGISQEGTWIVAGKSKLSSISYSTTIGYGAAYGASVYAADIEDNSVWLELQHIIDNHHPYLILVNFPSTDRAGHSGIWEDYTSAIKEFDSIVYDLWNYIQSDQSYKDTTVLIVTGDHGRNDADWTRHDGEGAEEIIFLALGPGIKRGYVSSRPRYQIDIEPTVGYLLGFGSPLTERSIIMEIFEWYVFLPIIMRESTRTGQLE